MSSFLVKSSASNITIKMNFFTSTLQGFTVLWWPRGAIVKFKNKDWKNKIKIKMETKTKMKMKIKIETKMTNKTKKYLRFGFCFCFLKVFRIFVNSMWPRSAIDGQLSLTWPRSAIAFSFANFPHGLAVP